jgi:hypothetical protein
MPAFAGMTLDGRRVVGFVGGVGGLEDGDGVAWVDCAGRKDFGEDA